MNLSVTKSDEQHKAAVHRLLLLVVDAANFNTVGL